MTRCKLGDHISIKHGYAFDGEYFTDEDNGVVLVTPGNFAIGGGYQEGKGKYFIGEYPSEFVLQPDDLIVTMTDLSKRIDTLGYGALVPDDGRVYLHNQRIGLVQFIDDEVDKHYLSFLMKSYGYQRAIAGSSSGSTVHHSSPDKICAYEFDLPSIEVQRRIASILMAYDNLIENNRRQIALLEEAAQRLYKEWFIDLRFPGHEDVEIVDGIPDGWTRMKLGDLVPIKTGKKDANYGTADGRFPFFTCAQEPIRSPGYSFDAAAILLAGNGDFYTKLYRGKFEAYQRTYVLIPKNSDDLYILYFALTNSLESLGVGANGSTIKYLTKRMIEEVSVLIPNRATQNVFNGIQAELFQEIEFLEEMIADTQEARDRLLPKLMSGEIEV